MFLDTHPIEYDAVIVGARVAGAATALQLAERGLRVLAIERSEYGSDTLSTLALMRAGASQLHRWGLIERLSSEGTPPIRSTSFHYGDEPEFHVDIKPREGLDALFAPRRSVLDRVLVDAARDAGAQIEHRARVTELLFEGRRVVGVVMADRDGRMSTVRAPLVIGADGANSLVAREVGAEVEVAGNHQSATVYGFFNGLGGDLANGYHWFYRPGGAAGVIPTNNGLSLIFASVPEDHFPRLRSGMAEDRSGFLAELHVIDRPLGEAVSRSKRVGSLKGFPGRLGHFRRSHGPGWALVGDAGYFKDPLTAHGLSDALRDAELLALSYARDGERGLLRYQNDRDALSRPLFEITDRIASFGWRLEDVQRDHLELSQEMNREVEAMTEWFGDGAAITLPAKLAQLPSLASAP